MLESLVHEIDTAEMELNELRKVLQNCGEHKTEAEKLVVQGKTLQEETKLLKSIPPEGLDEDTGVRYYVAVGMLEQQISELKDIKHISDRNIESNRLILEDLGKHIAEQQKLVLRLETVVEERRKEARSSEGMAVAKRMLENELRATKLSTKEFKDFLVEYINKIGTLDPNIENGDVPIGYLLQSLWYEFQINNKEGWISIEDLDFEVRKEDVTYLLECEVIKMKADDRNIIQLIDFTMQN